MIAFLIAKPCSVQFMEHQYLHLHLVREMTLPVWGLLRIFLVPRKTVFSKLPLASSALKQSIQRPERVLFSEKNPWFLSATQVGGQVISFPHHVSQQPCFIKSNKYLEPVCPLFWWLNPPKQGLFQSKQGSFGFQVINNSHLTCHGGQITRSKVFFHFSGGSSSLILPCLGFPSPVPLRSLKRARWHSCGLVPMATGRTPLWVGGLGGPMCRERHPPAALRKATNSQENFKLKIYFNSLFFQNEEQKNRN